MKMKYCVVVRILGFEIISQYVAHCILKYCEQNNSIKSQTQAFNKAGEQEQLKHSSDYARCRMLTKI